jgi:predicted AAA+ superfamily ATPase
VRPTHPRSKRMTKQAWTPWHQVARLREDLKTVELSLALLAADLYNVVMERGRTVYRDPVNFFSLTYPTFNLREFTKDAALRLAGRSDKAVGQN